MKIGILCTMINEFGTKGFYNSQEIGLGRAMIRKGHVVTVYKCLNRREYSEREKLQPEPGLTVLYLPIGGMGAHGYLDPRILEKDMHGLFCFSDNQIFLPHIYRFCRKHGICFIPYVGTAHSLHRGVHARVMDTLFAAGTLRIFKKTCVLVKTEAAARELERLGVVKTMLAPVGLDTAVLKEDFRVYDRGALRGQYGFKADEVILCSVSRLEPEKRPLDLLELFKRIREKKVCRLLLIGDGSMRWKVEEKIVKDGLSDAVKYLRRIPYEEMWKLYVLSDYFINLNRGEIFGMAIMEAMYYETSVAAIAAPGPSLTLRGMKGHKLCRDDRQIEEWVTGPCPSQKDLRESSERVVKKLGWSVCADQVLAAIAEFQENRPVSGGGQL